MVLSMAECAFAKRITDLQKKHGTNSSAPGCGAGYGACHGLIDTANALGPPPPSPSPLAYIDASALGNRKLAPALPLP